MLKNVKDDGENIGKQVVYDIGGKRKYRMRFHEPTEIRTYIVNPV